MSALEIVKYASIIVGGCLSIWALASEQKRWKKTVGIPLAIIAMIVALVAQNLELIGNKKLDTRRQSQFLSLTAQASKNLLKQDTLSIKQDSALIKEAASLKSLIALQDQEESLKVSQGKALSGIYGIRFPIGVPTGTVMLTFDLADPSLSGLAKEINLRQEITTTNLDSLKTPEARVEIKTLMDSCRFPWVRFQRICELPDSISWLLSPNIFNPSTYQFCGFNRDQHALSLCVEVSAPGFGGTGNASCMAYLPQWKGATVQIVGAHHPALRSAGVWVKAGERQEHNFNFNNCLSPHTITQAELMMAGVY